MGNSQLNDIPGTRREVVQLGTITANTYPYDGNVETVLLRATDNITIESVRIQYPRTITGNNVNHHTLNIITRTAIYGGPRWRTRTSPPAPTRRPTPLRSCGHRRARPATLRRGCTSRYRSGLKARALRWQTP